MAGCPEPPVVQNTPKDQTPPPSNQRKIKLRNSNKSTVNNRGSFSHFDVSRSKNFIVDSTSAVGVLIQHFLSASEELHKVNQTQGDAKDLLRLARHASLHRSISPTSDDGVSDQSEDFVQFMTRVNNE